MQLKTLQTHDNYFVKINPDHVESLVGVTDHKDLTGIYFISGKFFIVQGTIEEVADYIQ